MLNYTWQEDREMYIADNVKERAGKQRRFSSPESIHLWAVDIMGKIDV